MTDLVEHKIDLGVASCGLFSSKFLDMPQPWLDCSRRHWRLGVSRAILLFDSLLVVVRLGMTFGEFFCMMLDVALCLFEFDVSLEDIYPKNATRKVEEPRDE